MNKLLNIINEEIASMNEQREKFTRVFHGTSNTGAKDILANGIDMDKSYGGYFGKGFYTAIDYNLAKSNYADFADDNDINERGVILEFNVDPNANILDLRDSDDFELYKPFSKILFKPDNYKIFTSNGIDGLYDNSFEGVVFYNPKALKLIKTHKL